MSNGKKILKIARRESDEKAVWFMRQAGRYLPEYSEVKGRGSFLDMMKSSDTISKISLLPLKYFDTDGIVIFSDILLPLTKMNYRVSYENGIEITEGYDEIDYYPPLSKAINKISTSVTDKTIIGITGGIFTVLSYVIDKGNRGYPFTKKALTENLPLDEIMDILTGYARIQAEAGCDIIQVFESWIGNVSTSFYQKYLKDKEIEFVQRLKEFGKPIIFFSEGSSHLYGEMKELDPDVFSIDWRTSITQFNRLYGDCVVQGNLDPYLLTSEDTVVEEEVRKILEMGNQLPGHIFNLGHGVPPWTDPRKLKLIVNEVKRFGR